MNPEISKLMKEMREKAENSLNGRTFDEKAYNLAEYNSLASPANILRLLDYFEREAPLRKECPGRVSTPAKGSTDTEGR